MLSVIKGNEKIGDSHAAVESKVTSSERSKPTKECSTPESKTEKRKSNRNQGRHVCPYCGHGCAKPSVLEKHVRAHTNERPYPCKVCGFAFKTKSNLYKHCKSRAHVMNVNGNGKVTVSNADASSTDSSGSVADVSDEEMRKSKIRENCESDNPSKDVVDPSVIKSTVITRVSSASPVRRSSSKDDVYLPSSVYGKKALNLMDSTLSGLTKLDRDTYDSWKMSSKASNDANDNNLPVNFSSTCGESSMTLSELGNCSIGMQVSSVDSLGKMSVASPKPGDRGVETVGRVENDENDICDKRVNESSCRVKNLGLKLTIPPPASLIQTANAGVCSTPASINRISKSPKVTSPEQLELHISKIISENAAIVETFDSLWPRRYLRQSSIGTSENVDAEIMKSEQASSLIKNRRHSDNLLWSSREHSHSDVTNVKSGGKFSSTCSRKDVNVGGDNVDVDADDCRGFMRSFCQSACTDMSRKESESPDKDLCVSNPEGSIIKDLLLQNGNPNSVYPAATTSSARPALDGPKMVPLHVNVTSSSNPCNSEVSDSLVMSPKSNSCAIYSCSTCHVSFRKRKNLEIHQMHYCRNLSDDNWASSVEEHKSDGSPVESSRVATDECNPKQAGEVSGSDASARFKTNSPDDLSDDKSVDDQPLLMKHLLDGQDGVKKRKFSDTLLLHPVKRTKDSQRRVSLAGYTKNEVMKLRREIPYRQNKMQFFGGQVEINDCKDKQTLVSCSSRVSHREQMSMPYGILPSPRLSNTDPFQLLSSSGGQTVASSMDHQPSSPFMVTIAKPLNSGGTVLQVESAQNMSDKTSMCIPVVAVGGPLVSSRCGNPWNGRSDGLRTRADTYDAVVLTTSVPPSVHDASNCGGFDSDNVVTSVLPFSATATTSSPICPFPSSASNNAPVKSIQPQFEFTFNRSEENSDSRSIEETQIPHRNLQIPIVTVTPESPLSSPKSVDGRMPLSMEGSLNFLAPKRPDSLPIKKKNVTMKLIGSTLISPDTPRPKKRYGQLHLNGHAYTYLGLKRSTRSTWCCTYRPQPMYVLQDTDSKLSMYSNWQVVSTDPEFHGLTPTKMMSLYDSSVSKKKDNRMSVCKHDVDCLITHSSYWAYRTQSPVSSPSTSNLSVTSEAYEYASPVRSPLFNSKTNSSTDLQSSYTQDDYLSNKIPELKNSELKISIAPSCSTTSARNSADLLQVSTDESLHNDSVLEVEDHPVCCSNQAVLDSSDTANHCVNSDDECSGKEQPNESNERYAGSRIRIFEGGFKSNEDYTYIRGRGRGKYICEECGIRCKKPSMLKKHIRTHTDLRPYTCKHCCFSFKTKGNLTKHMKSKAHHKKCVELGVVPVPTVIEDSQIDEEALAKQEELDRNRGLMEDGDDEDECDDDDDDEVDAMESEDETSTFEAVGIIADRAKHSKSPCCNDDMSVGNSSKHLFATNREAEVAKSLLNLRGIVSHADDEFCAVPTVKFRSSSLSATDVDDGDRSVGKVLPFVNTSRSAGPPRVQLVHPQPAVNRSKFSVHCQQERRSAAPTRAAAQSGAFVPTFYRSLASKSAISPTHHDEFYSKNANCAATACRDISSRPNADTWHDYGRFAATSMRAPRPELSGGDNSGASTSEHQTKSVVLPRRRSISETEIEAPVPPQRFGKMRKYSFSCKEPLSFSSLHRHDRRTDDDVSFGHDAGGDVSNDVQPIDLSISTKYSCLSRRLMQDDVGNAQWEDDRRKHVNLSMKHAGGSQLCQSGATTTNDVSPSTWLSNRSAEHVLRTRPVTTEENKVFECDLLNPASVVANDQKSNNAVGNQDQLGHKSSFFRKRTPVCSPDATFVQSKQLKSSHGEKLSDSPEKDFQIVETSPDDQHDDEGTPLPSYSMMASYTNSLGEDSKCMCQICHKFFTKPSQLRLHVNIHYIERPFRCDSCAVSFRTKGHLEKHKRSLSHYNKVNMNLTFGTPTTENPRPFKCTDCKIAFRIHGHLAKHLRSKLHIMKLECIGKLPFGTYAEMERSGTNLSEIDTTDCDNSLESLQIMAQKMYGNKDATPATGSEGENVTHEELRSPPDEVVVSGQGGKIVRSPTSCSIVKQEPIEKRYNNDHNGLEYAVESDSDESELDVTTPKPWSCSLCRLIFKSAKLLEVHISQAHRSHALIEDGHPEHQRHCNIVSVHPSSISSIVDLHHRVKKNQVSAMAAVSMTCSMCGKGFTSDKEFQQHILTHAQPRPFICDICDAGFITLPLLNLHTDSHHQMPLMCKSCGYSFSDTASLHKHIRDVHLNK